MVGALNWLVESPTASAFILQYRRPPLANRSNSDAPAPRKVDIMTSDLPIKIDVFIDYT